MRTEAEPPRTKIETPEAEVSSASSHLSDDDLIEKYSQLAGAIREYPHLVEENGYSSHFLGDEETYPRDRTDPHNVVLEDRVVARAMRGLDDHITREEIERALSIGARHMARGGGRDMFEMWCLRVAGEMDALGLRRSGILDLTLR